MKILGMEFGTAAAEIPEHLNLAEQLSAAQKAVGDFEQKQNLLSIRIADVADKTERLSKNNFGSDDLSRSRRSRLVDVQHEVSSLQVEKQNVEHELAATRSQVEALWERIGGHAIFSAAISEHEALVKQAVELGKKSWRAPVGEIASLERQIEILVHEEAQFVSEANSRLRGAGLPELKPRLRGVAFVPPVTDFNFVALERDAAEGMRRASDF